MRAEDVTEMVTRSTATSEVPLKLEDRQTAALVAEAFLPRLRRPARGLEVAA